MASKEIPFPSLKRLPAELLLLVMLALLFMLPERLAIAARPKLAVMPLVGIRIDKNITKILTDIMTVEVGNMGRHDVISADEIDDLLGMEKMKGAIGCDDVSCAAEIGGALGVELMLSGNVGRLGDSLTIKLSLFDTRRSKVKKRVLVQVKNDENLYARGVKQALSKVLGVPQAGSGSSVSAAKPTEPAAPEGYDKTLGEKKQRKKRLARIEQTKRLELSLNKLPANPYKKWGHVAFWSGLGLGALFVSLGHGMAYSKYKSYSDVDDTDTVDANRRWSGLAVLGYAIGAAGLVTGLILWLLSPGDKAWAARQQQQAWLGITANDKGAYVSMQGRW